MILKPLCEITASGVLNDLFDPWTQVQKTVMQRHLLIVVFLKRHGINLAKSDGSIIPDVAGTLA